MRVGLIDSTTSYSNPLMVNTSQRPFKGETIRVTDMQGVASHYEVLDVCHPAWVQGADMAELYLSVKEKA